MIPADGAEAVWGLHVPYGHRDHFKDRAVAGLADFILLDIRTSRLQ